MRLLRTLLRQAVFSVTIATCLVAGIVTVWVLWILPMAVYQSIVENYSEIAPDYLWGMGGFILMCLPFVTYVVLLVSVFLLWVRRKSAPLAWAFVIGGLAGTQLLLAQIWTSHVVLVFLAVVTIVSALVAFSKLRPQAHNTAG